MNLRSLFIREHDGSACKNGMCRHDAKCDSRNCAGHPRNNERQIASDPIGVEAALPIQYVGTEPAPFNWELTVIWIAVAVAFGAVLALSIVDPRNLTDWLPAVWPRLVVALS
jgi:hypothetical protein